jgi:4-hydroxybenzoate polyprenyltransferase
MILLRLLKTSHLGPTLIVTLVSILLAGSLTSFLRALIIGAAVFTGQLCVGWTNDLLDEESDRAEGRTDKPIAQGHLSQGLVIRATMIALGLTFSLSLLGPLGIRGGMTHLLGVGCGVAYNFFFKSTLFSPLPYLIAFAALPSSIVMSQGYVVPIWLISAGALFGLGAHFANVVKDMEQDRIAGIKGLPQLLGSKISLFIAGLSLIEIGIILGVVTKNKEVVPLSIFAGIAIFALPKRFSFPLILAIAVVDVGVLVSLGSDYLVLRS